MSTMVAALLPQQATATVPEEGSFERFILSGSLCNLRIQGVHVLVDRSLATDSAVRLRLHGVGCFDGRIAWRAADRIGVSFVAQPERVIELACG
jgi:hypothetical protein